MGLFHFFPTEEGKGVEEEVEKIPLIQVERASSAFLRWLEEERPLYPFVEEGEAKTILALSDRQEIQLFQNNI